jgi:hypothetical protein
MMEKGAAQTPRTRWLRGASIHALVVMAYALAAVALLGSAVMAAAQPTAQPSAQPAQSEQSAPPTVAAIPIPEVAQHAEQVATLLRSSDGTAAADAGVDRVEVQLAEAGDWIRRRLVSTTDALASSPSANALANLTDSWQVMRSRLAGLDDFLTTRATVVQQRVDQLETIRTTWAATRANALGFTASPTVLARIDETLTAITASRRSADDQLAYLLGLQDRIVKEMTGHEVPDEVGDVPDGFAQPPTQVGRHPGAGFEAPDRKSVARWQGPSSALRVCAILARTLSLRAHVAARILESECEPLAGTDQVRWSRGPRAIEVTAKRMRVFRAHDRRVRRVRCDRSHAHSPLPPPLLPPGTAAVSGSPSLDHVCHASRSMRPRIGRKRVWRQVALGQVQDQVSGVSAQTPTGDSDFLYAAIQYTFSLLPVLAKSTHR